MVQPMGYALSVIGILRSASTAAPVKPIIIAVNAARISTKEPPNEQQEAFERKQLARLKEKYGE